MAIHFSEEFIDQLLAQVDMMQLMEKHHVRVKAGSGENHYYIADFCCGKKDFDNGRIKKSTQTYKCGSCHTGGNAIHFLRNVAGKTFHEAVSELADMAGIPLPEDQVDRKQQRKEEALALAAEFYHDQGNFDYFLSRGISMEVLKKYKAGYAPGGRTLRSHLERQGFTKEELQEFKLLNRRGLDRFFYRAVIPIVMFGRVVDLYGRAVDDSLAGINHQYLYGDIPFLGGYDFIKSGQLVTIYESFIDQLVAESHGILNGTNPGGAGKFTGKHARMIHNKTDKAVLLFDGDQAGREGALAAGRMLVDTGVQTWVGELPEGEDPAQMISEKGLDHFKSFLTGKSYEQFEMYCTLQKYSLQDIERYVNEMKSRT
ncbi:CHC2 zinc finger domain-containing protein [Paenibacillus jiagnxiensis]|uniref:CHC2 zinc finger domain-containing protein n=1 Tax=Paenibacillus jiagnxiensis TaxID=3228926 RepID=UPI0033B4211C